MMKPVLEARPHNASVQLLTGKIILITGAASGIGAATALLAASEGAHLCIADIDGDGVKELATRLRSGGSRVIAVQCDVSSQADVTRMVQASADEYGRLDGAFNNAGVGSAATRTMGKRLHEITDDSWDTMLAINLSGVWRCMKEEIKLMSSGGSIVNMASIGGLVGLPTAAAYVAAKHGVIGLTKAAAIDYGRDGLRINAICPGYVDTPLTAKASEEKRDAIMEKTPIRRFATPHEIAQNVIWLLSDRTSYTTGASLVVDGGYTTW